MNHTARPLSLLVMSSLCFQCVTPQAGVSLGSPPVSISCEYVEKGQRSDETEAECIMTNQAATPARLIFKQVSLEDPHAEIEPIDARKIKSVDRDDIVLILGVIIIVAGIIALLSKSKGYYSIHVPITDYGWSNDTAARPARVPEVPQKTVITDTFEIPGYRTIRFVFLAKHGNTRPEYLALYLGDDPNTLIKVPIKQPIGWSKKRADW